MLSSPLRMATLIYRRSGMRPLGYDNERPKEDRRHQGDRGQAYRFESPEKLSDDFLREVKEGRAEQ